MAIGTRPEAIKMFPVIHALRQSGKVAVRVLVTAQHREMLDQVLNFARIEPDIDLDLMQQGQSLDTLSARILTEFGKALDRERPDRVLVHGDTITTMMATLACYFRQIPVGHVEAGLRSGDIFAPWPEEINRKVTSLIADLHFAPTQSAAEALLGEGIDENAIHVTGNTVIDALLHARETITGSPELTPQIAELKKRTGDRRIIAVTAHRRENFGCGLEQVAAAIKRLAQRPDVAVIYPLHPNPSVADLMRKHLEDTANVLLTPPLDYLEFVGLMEASEIILTDSGGIQEEAPSLGKPVLVMREKTERPEGIAAGTALLVGAKSEAILAQCERLLDNSQHYAAMAQAHNPYGDGKAASKIAEIIEVAHAPCAANIAP